MKKYAKKQRRSSGGTPPQDLPVMRRVTGHYLGPDNRPIERLSCGHLYRVELEPAPRYSSADLSSASPPHVVNLNPPSRRATRPNRRRCLQCEAPDTGSNGEQRDPRGADAPAQRQTAEHSGEAAGNTGGSA